MGGGGKHCTLINEGLLMSMNSGKEEQKFSVEELTCGRAKHWDCSGLQHTASAQSTVCRQPTCTADSS